MNIYIRYVSDGLLSDIAKTTFMTFKELNITEPILKAIKEKGYIVPTPIQEKAIPAALAKREIRLCADWYRKDGFICHSYHTTFASREQGICQASGYQSLDIDTYP